MLPSLNKVYYYCYYIIIVIIIIIIITICRLDLKSDVGSSQNVLIILFFLFQSGTSAITLMLCMRMLYFILNLKRLPSPPPSPPKEVFQLKLSCQSLQWLAFNVRFVS